MAFTRKPSAMTSDPHSRGGPPTYVQDGAVAPSHAERTRTLVAGESDATLSTVALEPAGYPFGSIVTYALDGRGAPLVLMSTMAEHANNLAADPRCSVMVTAGGDGAGRLAAARATLIGTMTRMPDEDQDAATEAYLAVHPNAFWAKFPDFFVARLHVESIRYVRGFGEMGWVTAEDYAVAEADPVAPAELGIVDHMNDDHLEALGAIVSHYLDVPDDVLGVTMLSCDRYGFEVRLDVSDEDNPVAFGRIAFPARLEDAPSARGAMVELTKAARA